MSIPRVHNPVPKKAQVSSNPFGVTPDCGSVTESWTFFGLEELVNDCFELSMNFLLDERRIQIVQKFEELVQRLHCGENLNFLIEIFKYEFYLDKMIPPENGVRERLNSVSGTITSQQSKNFEFPSVGLKIRSSSSSIKSVDLEPTSVFVSSLDDLGSFPGEGNIQSAWEGLGDKIVDDESIEFITLDDVNEESLFCQWNHIINTYIRHDSPEQINLSNKVYNSIMEEHNKFGQIHSSVVLMPAKKEVLRLLRENVYLRFISEEKKSSSASPVCHCQNFTPNKNSCNSTQIGSPTLSPLSASKDIKNCKMNRRLHSPTPMSMIYNDDSGSSTTSSLTNLLGHLKLNSSAPPSNLHSLSNSPAQQQEENKSYAAKFGKIWRKKKNTGDNQK